MPDIGAVFRIVEIAQTFETGLRGIDHSEVVHDLRDLHALLAGIRSRYGSLEAFLKALDGQKPR